MLVADVKRCCLSLVRAVKTTSTNAGGNPRASSSAGGCRVACATAVSSEVPVNGGRPESIS